MEPERIGFMLKDDIAFIIQHYAAQARQLMKEMRETNKPDSLLEISKQAFYLQSYIYDIEFFGYPAQAIYFSKMLSAEFAEKEIFVEIQKEAFARAIGKIAGQYKIGENEYVIIDGKIYYRTLLGKWYQIDESSVFLLNPDLINMDDCNLTQQLNEIYSPVEIDELYNYWQRYNTENIIPKDIIKLETHDTTPEGYSNLATGQIKDILQRSISLRALQQLHHEDENYLERLIKVGHRLVLFVARLREDDTNMMYLLRDGMMFSEIHSALDMIGHPSGANTQVMINRKNLSTDGQDEHYWNFCVDALHRALRNNDHHFEKFYSEYKKIMTAIEDKEPQFKETLAKIANYLEQQSKELLSQNKRLNVVDTGCHGSIAMLTKYLMDTKVFPKFGNSSSVDIRLFITNSWLKGVYEGKYASNYYPMMKDIEIFNRSENLYRYKEGSLERGKLKVTMGNEYHQLLANIELIVLVTLCKIMKDTGRLISKEKI